ncbi:hypothetical protein PROFUN_10770, partial [Planoprotostelium fungivorum]
MRLFGAARWSAFLVLENGPVLTGVLVLRRGAWHSVSVDVHLLRGAAVIGSGWLRCDRWTLDGEQASLLGDAPRREAHSIKTRFQEFIFFQRDVTQGAQV